MGTHLVVVRLDIVHRHLRELVSELFQSVHPDSLSFLSFSGAEVGKEGLTIALRRRKVEGKAACVPAANILH